MGRAHTAASGYTSPWIGGAGERHLDVAYYQDLQNLLWRQVITDFLELCNSYDKYNILMPGTGLQIQS